MKFSDLFDANRLRDIPDDGHSILLMETANRMKTFSDYPNLLSFLDAITHIYEEYRSSLGMKRDDYDLNALMAWVDEFNTFELLVFDKEISRYKRKCREDVKSLIVQQIQKIL